MDSQLKYDVHVNNIVMRAHNTAEGISQTRKNTQNAKSITNAQKLKLNLKPTFIFKNCSYACAYHCVQLTYTTQHRTVLIIPSYPPDNHHSADNVYWRGRDSEKSTTKLQTYIHYTYSKHLFLTSFTGNINT